MSLLHDRYSTSWCNVLSIEHAVVLQRYPCGWLLSMEYCTFPPTARINRFLLAVVFCRGTSLRRRRRSWQNASVCSRSRAKRSMRLSERRTPKSERTISRRRPRFVSHGLQCTGQIRRTHRMRPYYMTVPSFYSIPAIWHERCST